MPSREFLSRPGSVWERTPFEGKELPALRAEMEALALSGLRKYDDVSWEAGSCGPLSGKWVRPKAPSDALLYYIHGGGFTLGSSGIPLPFLMELSHRLGLTCFSADYRLAPEHPFPAAPDDAFSGYRALLELGYDPQRIVICGESAGATLSLVTVLMAKQAGLPLPRAVAALSPVTDAAPELARSSDQVLDELPTTEEVWNIYAPGADLSDFRISPARGDLEGFPPVFLSVGSTESLLADALIFTQNLSRAGGDVRLHVGRDMIHTYPLDLWDYPEAMTAFEEIELFLSQLLFLGKKK